MADLLAAGTLAWGVVIAVVSALCYLFFRWITTELEGIKKDQKEFKETSRGDDEKVEANITQDSQTPSPCQLSNHNVYN